MHTVGRQYVDSYKWVFKKRLPFWDAGKEVEICD